MATITFAIVILCSRKFHLHLWSKTSFLDLIRDLELIRFWVVTNGNDIKIFRCLFFVSVQQKSLFRELACLQSREVYCYNIQRHKV